MKNLLEKLLLDSIEKGLPNADAPHRCGKTTFLRNLIMQTKLFEPNKHITMITPSLTIATVCYRDLYNGRIINLVVSEYSMPNKLRGIKTDYIFSDEVGNDILHRMCWEFPDFVKKYKCGFHTSTFMGHNLDKPEDFFVLDTSKIV